MAKRVKQGINKATWAQTFIKLGPKLSRLNLKLSHFSSELDHNCPELDHLSPELKVVPFCSKVILFEPNLGQFEPIVGPFHLKLANKGLWLAEIRPAQGLYTLVILGQGSHEPTLISIQPNQSSKVSILSSNRLC